MRQCQDGEKIVGRGGGGFEEGLRDVQKGLLQNHGLGLQVTRSKI